MRGKLIYRDAIGLSEFQIETVNQGCNQLNNDKNDDHMMHNRK